MSAKPKLKVIHGHAYATSLDLAKHFKKSHNNVMRDIRKVNLDISLLNFEQSNEFSLVNFEESTYTNKRGKEYPIFHLSRDGFALVAMGFTGKEALEWKIKYITAFNKMESELQNKKFHSTQDTQLKLFPEFQTEVTGVRPAMQIRFAYQQMIRKGIPSYTPETLKAMVKRGTLEGCKINGIWCVYEDSFAEFLKNRKL